MKLKRTMIGDFPLNTDREAETYDHVEQLVEHDQPPPAQLDPEHVAFLLKPLLEPLVLESAKLRHEMRLLLEDLKKARDFIDTPASLSANIGYTLNYYDRKLLFVFSTQAVTLNLSSGGTISLTANAWTPINFMRGTILTAPSVNDATPVSLIFRACDTFFFDRSAIVAAGAAAGAAQAVAQVAATGIVAPWLLNESVTTVGTNVVLVANTVYLVPIEVAGACTCTGIRFRTVTATGTSDVGIYDANGNLLAHSGAVANSGALQTLNLLAPLALAPGRYILAITPSNSTDTYQINGGNIAGLVDAYTATNAAVAGVLPNTTGVLVTSAQKLQIVGLIVGGAP